MTRRSNILIALAASAFLVTALSGIRFVRASGTDTEQTFTDPTPTPSPTIAEEDEVVKVDTDAVNVLFTAQDRNRRLLTTLKPEDIRILENGQVQTIESFSRQVDLPMSLSILIDVSLSQDRTLPEEKEAAMSFLENVIRPSKDEVSVVSFTGDSTLEQGMTNNMPRLRRAVDRVRVVVPSGYLGSGVSTGTPPAADTSAGATAIWDAVWVTSEEVLGPAPDKTRRAIILLTDGLNTYGQKNLNDAVQAAQKAEAVVYAIGIGDRYYHGVDTGVLQKIAERTGGRAYFPRDENDLRDAFKQIQDEMRSQYLIAYEPTNSNKDGSYRTIEIQIANSQLEKDKVKITHRQGYFAKSDKSK